MRMEELVPMRVIAHIRTDFAEKFGVPRQSGIEGLQGKIVFAPPFRNRDAVRGIEQYSHLWLLWQFHKAHKDDFSPTVRPPKLGGNERMGVFATRSPFRPNAIGLSSVRLEKVDLQAEDAPVLYVSGADLVDMTPIFDIKPYLPYTDSHPDAAGGFSLPFAESLRVHCPDELLSRLPAEKRRPLLAVLAQDPRPAYQNDPQRAYGFRFAGFDVRFFVKDGTLTVFAIL